ncbi:MAG: glutaminase A [Anaerovoracaceae bacterium]|nr:glutaminase A [Anaerovoracaceae bacterium]
MTEQNIKVQKNNEYVIDKRYHLMDAEKTKAILQKSMDLAREEIPKGAVATYIPELSKMDPHQLGICVYPLSGEKICLGDYDVRFTMQSVSKVLMLIVGLEICGTKAVFERVGMEPSGEAFDSLVELDVNDSKPYNPLINSGALAVCGMLMREVSFQDMIRYTRNVCVDPDITLNETVFDSEMKTCARNRSIAYLLQSKGIITSDVEDTLKFYTKMCSMNVTAESLANLGKKLANDGVCIMTGKRYMSSRTARIVKTLMLTCGMYDGSGTFAIRVGIPTKSGVGGGLLSVSDKRAGIGVFGPALDAQGNSIAGCKLLREISNELRLNLFYDPEWNKEDAGDTVLMAMR